MSARTGIVIGSFVVGLMVTPALAAGESDFRLVEAVKARNTQAARALLKEHAVVTLLFSSKEERLNNAAALKAYLRK